MSDFQPYWDGLLKIVGMYAADKETTAALLKNSDVPVTVCDAVYCYLVGRGEIPAIETLGFDLKDKLWRESVFRKTKRKRIAYCRSCYLLTLI